jgi:type I restriction enzyme, S subunit
VNGKTGEKKEMPRGWVDVMLGDVCETTSGGTPSRSRSSFYVGSIPWVKSGELEYNTIYKTEERISDDAINNSSAKLLPKGTLLIALYGATVGKLAFLGVEAATNQAVCAIIPPEYLSRIFLYYFLFFSKEVLLNKRIGGAQPNISQGILRELEFPLPPLPEQQRIVVKIEDLFYGLDAGITALKKAKEQLKTYRQSVLKWAFKGKLTEKWRKLFVQHMNGDSVKAWEKGEFGEIIISAQNGISKRSGTVGKPYKVLRLADIFSGSIIQKEPRYINLSDIEIGKYKLNIGDLVCIRVNGSSNLVGRMILVEKDDNWSFCDHFIRFKISPNADSKYIRYFFDTKDVRNYIQHNMVSSAGQNTVSQPTMKAIAIPLPSLQEQLAIVSEIESRLSLSDNLEKAIDESLSKATALRQSILKRAFEGKLVPQDRNDEPAEKLLQRIKKEKDKEPLNKVKAL